jgi:hypothetical protein
MKNEYDFDNDVLPYVERFPYISNKPKEQPDGNPILYLGLTLCAKRQFFELTKRDFDLVTETYKRSAKAPGLITRGEHKWPDHQAHDDLIGLTHASYFTDFRPAHEIYNYGEENYWFYNPAGVKWFKDEHGKFKWFAKFKCFHAIRPGVVQHYKLAAGQALDIIDQIWWAIGIMTGKKNNEGGLQLEWLMVDLYLNQSHRYAICDKAAMLWQNALYMNQKYPQLMGSVFEKYFGPDHYLAKWMQGLIFKRRTT